MSGRIAKLLDSLDQPVFCLAPMVDVNDLGFRMMARKNGVKLCWTGMINSHIWAQDIRKRKELFQTCPEDRPLICQISGSIDEELISTAIDLQPFCDAIDINLGCTQHIARRGQYGYFMVNTDEKRQNVIQLVKKLSSAINVPLTVKIRILNDESGNPSPIITTQFAKALAEAGAQMISVHGRHQQLAKAGSVNDDAIHDIVNAVNVPVIANGGVTDRESALSMLHSTGARGVMVGQGFLDNPYMFNTTKTANPIEASKEYMGLYAEHPSDIIIMKRHIFLFFETLIRKNSAIADRIKECHSVDDLNRFLDDFQQGAFKAEEHAQ